MTIEAGQDDGRVRCGWGSRPEPDYRAYHDAEWGVPVRDERHLFELLVLEGAQAGLSWWTILRKRAGYRAAFADFDPAVVAAFAPADVERLMDDPGIVRNRPRSGRRSTTRGPRSSSGGGSASSPTSGRSSTAGRW